MKPAKTTCPRALAIVCLALLLVSGFMASVHAEQTNQYYVDSVDGDDVNAGDSRDLPWRTLARLEAQSLEPGDVVNLKRGSHWNASLIVTDSGESGNPVTFQTYGQGHKPIISRSGDSDTWAKAVSIYADWVVIDGLAIQDVSEAAVYIGRRSEYNVIRNCEITDAGIGVAVYGQHNLVTENDIHDLHLVVNTPGGDDDYGAVGVWLFNSDNEVSYNRLVECRGPSYDYGTDGGAVEFYGAVNNSYVHHNWAQDCEGFLEVGGSDGEGREAYDSLIAYNVLIDNTRALHFNLGAYQYAVDVDNMRFENNTVVETTSWETAVNFVQGELTGSQLILRNNVFYGFYRLARVLSDGSDTPSTAFVHEHNLYSGIWSQLDLGEGEIKADPLFVDRADDDLRLQSSSPAIDSGADLGHTLDFVGGVVPSGAGPDMGAYEYGAAATATPTATQTSVPPTATATPTNTATATNSPTATQTAEPSETPSPAPTNTSTVAPTSTPTTEPTITPTLGSTPTPTTEPTATPTQHIELQTFDITLRAGLNMISLPLQPTDSAIEVVLAPLGDALLRVWAHDSASPSNPWRVYEPGDTSGGLATLDLGKGYWFEMSQPAALTIQGQAVSSTLIPLRSGRNLIGYPALGNQDFAVALESIDGLVDTVWQYDASDSRDPWSRYSPTKPPWSNDLVRFEEGKGYWIVVTADCALQLP